MDEQQCGGIEFQSAPQDFPRINGDMIDCALAENLVRDQDILSVQKKNTELFGFTVRHDCVAIIEHSLPTGKQRPIYHFGPCDSLRAGFDHPDLADDSIVHTRHNAQPRIGCCNDTPKITELAQKPSGNAFCNAFRDDAKQYLFEQILIRQCV